MYLTLRGHTVEIRGSPSTLAGGLETPYQLARGDVQSVEIAVVTTEEDQPIGDGGRGAYRSAGFVVPDRLSARPPCPLARLQYETF